MVKICTTCRREFKRPAGFSNKQWAERLYCSLTCSGEARKLRRVSKLCLGCKTLFKVPKHLEARKFCSRRCKEQNQAMFAPKGEDAPNWQGGISAVNNKIRHSKQYRDWRKKVFERDGYTCQGCGLRGGTLNADHIKSFAQHAELRMDVNNGRTLCVPCHKLTPNTP